MNFKQSFGKQLQKLRKSRNITQEKLAELVDIHPRQISKIETGDHFPKNVTLENLCIHLQIHPRDLFDFDFMDYSQYEQTGTGTVLNYRATVKNNVVYLRDLKKNITEIEEDMFVMAKNIGRSVIVQYRNHDTGITKTIEYFPDKTYKILDTTNAKEIEDLIENVKELSKDKQYLEFLKLSVSALKNTEDLNRLEMLLAGIKLAHKK